MHLPFARSAQSTLGVEWELALVDAADGTLRPVADRVLAGVADQAGLHLGQEHPHVKPELLLNTVELVTDVCTTVDEAIGQLRESARKVREVTGPMGVELYCQGSHPFAQPTEEPVTPADRYGKLIDRTQWWGRQMLIYGVHVHVGLDDVRKAMPVVDGLVNYVPHFLALSASSPFWAGVDTGYQSQRTLMFQQLPTAGLPFQFPDWDGFERCVADLVHTGVIDDVTECRWDVRAVPRLGTVEMRVCDGVATLEEIAAIAALTQCLVQDFSDTLDAGGTIPTMPPWHVQENKWRAARYGLEAIIILDAAGDEMLVTEHLRSELERLAPVAERLGCAAELASVEDLMHDGGTPARQRRVAAHAAHAASVEQAESAGLPASAPLDGHDVVAPLRAVVADAVGRTRASIGS
ncbi:glutamate--cysteine ligase [Citricoccus sp. SGAir0253]|uniref:glutamate--cysteine ligase n=1 Tax=Citricoccus sp. SGAir0253 TaxID=2567881 RepID=UPI0010CCDEFD|nr:glutamate--cysteine ligase [Citricoccus sp. SGAir0253]QCU77601.1 glutamate--cysteine ligase [Citricoccus sp. SGAir0253]